MRLTAIVHNASKPVGGVFTAISVDLRLIRQLHEAVEVLLEKQLKASPNHLNAKRLGGSMKDEIPRLPASSRCGSIGIDQFIGAEECINRGIGTKAIQMFVEMIMRERKPTSIILDPSPENKRAIRCYEKAGFKHYETKAGEEGLAYMMRLEK